MSESLGDLRPFVAAYEERSFTAAAEHENATPSGVSQHIRKIEDRFGVRLFTRTAGPVVPTPAGDDDYRGCVELLRAYETANRAMRRFGCGLEGDVTIGLMPTMTHRVLAPALARFTGANPNAAVRIVGACSAVLTQGVRAGELSFAIVPATPCRRSGISCSSTYVLYSTNFRSADSSRSERALGYARRQGGA